MLNDILYQHINIFILIDSFSCTIHTEFFPPFTTYMFFLLDWNQNMHLYVYVYVYKIAVYAKMYFVM